MSAALRLTYPFKSNNPGDPDNVKKFSFTDANDVKEVVADHATHIDNINQALGLTLPTLNLGTFQTLQILQAAYPDGEGTSYAVIDDGLGGTPQVATYNTGNSTWEVATPDDQIVFVANLAGLPATGVANRLYIALDSGAIRYWHSAEYQVAGGTTATVQRVRYVTQGANKYRVFKGDGNEGNGFEIGDKVDDWADTTKTVHYQGEVLDASLALPADFTDQAKFFVTNKKTRLT